MRVFDKKATPQLSSNHYLNFTIILITATIVIFSMPLNAVIVEWNKDIRLPSFLSELEEWAMNKEAVLQEVTLFITDFDNHWEFIFGLLVVAVLPGIGEELLFRGLMQPKITKLTGNVHAGIWITALIFSFFHFQFYGLIPRMLLGALFGYLYIWSGNLIVPMIAHFVNNGFTLLMIYLNKLEVTSMDIESTEVVPTSMILFSILVTAFLLFAFYMYYKNLRRNGLIRYKQDE
jgi:membrane protease YdiL (CAAX protease family)